MARLNLFDADDEGLFGSLPEAGGEGRGGPPLDTLLATTPRRHMLRDRLLKEYRTEERAVAAILGQPYEVILSIAGAGWVSADAVGRACGIKPNDQRRLAAAIIEVMQQAETWGHCWHPPGRLMDEVARMTGAGRGDSSRAIQAAADDGRVYAEGSDRVWFPKLHRHEVRLSEAIAKVRTPATRRGEFVEPIHLHDPATWGDLKDDQAEALYAVMERPLTVIHGPPGSGKTHMLKDLLRRFRGTYELVAPTGRAAKRMSESTGRQAKTIHRALVPKFDGSRFLFTREHVDVDLLIVDESSMLSLSLATDLFTRVRAGTRVVLIGDPHQLPAVGPGDVLRDILRSGAVTVAELRSIKRQDDAAIVRACSEVLKGVVPRLPKPGETDLAFIPKRTSEQVADTARKLLRHDGMRAKHGAEDDITGIQVITPRRSGNSPIACNPFNAHLWNLLHPGGGKPRPEVGDKVMQTTNDYSLGVMNGDLGRVVKAEGGRVTVEVDGELVEAKLTQWDLDHAWATTIHKGQGSEWPVTILMMHGDAGGMLLTRQLFYTALSRARNLCVIVGITDAIDRAVKNDREERRRTGLADRIRAEAVARSPIS